MFLHPVPFILIHPQHNSTCAGFTVLDTVADVELFGHGYTSLRSYDTFVAYVFVRNRSDNFLGSSIDDVIHIAWTNRYNHRNSFRCSIREYSPSHTIHLHIVLYQNHIGTILVPSLVDVARKISLSYYFYSHYTV
jgi:hypothetical protein